MKKNRAVSYRGGLIFSLLWLAAGAVFPASAEVLASPLQAPGPTLTVDVAASRHAISPYIYGLNNYGTNPADFNSFMQELKLPVDRWGGNLNSRYNWQSDTTNHGSDFFFENDSVTGADAIVANDRVYKAQSIITVPTIGYVAKNGSQDSCGFSVAKYGAQQMIDAPFHPDCGNGVKPDNSKVVGNDPLDTSIAITPNFIRPWIAHLTNLYGTAANGGVMFYELDNEPSDWFETHRDVHPGRLTYDELKAYTIQYAPAIKAMDPTAKTLGPSNFGYFVYADSRVPGDKAAHGNIGFSEWYLQQMQAYETANGVRILDYFDQHYYPAQNGVALAPAGDAATQQLRLRSTRSLWDPSYIDESYIGTDLLDPPIQLIPTFRKWIADNYPGTKTAITEYNFGGVEDINGALTQADVLGIFGREQLDLATIWQPPSSRQPAAYAFRAFRNYDGAGSAFGDMAVLSTSSDSNQGQLPVYAAVRTLDNTLTLVIINKTNNDLTSPLNLSNFNPAASGKVFRYSAVNLNAIVPQPAQAVSRGGFTATYPANSITIMEIAQAAAQANPVPSLSTLNPDFMMAGDPAFTLTVNGSNFVSSAKVLWNDTERPTTFINSSQLTAQISANDISVSGTYLVKVFNPAPGGGTSGPLSFMVVPKPVPNNIVKSPTDDGSGNDPLSLSGKIKSVPPGSTIGFQVQGNTITLSGLLPPLPNGVNLMATCTTPITINALSSPAGPVLTLSGTNALEGLTIKHSGGTSIKVPRSSRGMFKCIKVQIS